MRIGRATSTVLHAARWTSRRCIDVGRRAASTDVVAGFIATQDAVKTILADSKPIGEVVNPTFNCNDFLYGEPDEWPEEVVPTPWAKFVKRLRRRYKAVQGEALQSAWSALTTATQFASTSSFGRGLVANVLVVTDKDGKRHEFPFDKPLDVPALLAHCSPSPFGDLATHTTRIDASVRAAMELKHKGVAGPGEAFFTLETRSMAGRRSGGSVAGSDARAGTGGNSGSSSSSAGADASSEEESLARDVAGNAQWMARDVPGRKLAAVPQKLSIYSPGGHFKRHVDTPVGDRPAMLGTALVALPSAFTGGDLIVEPPLPRYGGALRHDGAKTTTASAAAAVVGSLTWAPDLRKPAAAQPDSTGRVHHYYPDRMVAFYGDCPHEVKPVRSGHRVTLSFALFARSDGSASGSDASAPSQAAAAPAAATPPALLMAPAAAAAPAANSAAASADRYTAALRARADGFVAQVRSSIAASAGKPFALMLQHGYTLSALDEARQHLKGADAVAWSALRAADANLGGAIVHLRSILYKHHEAQPGNSFKTDWDERYELSSYVYSFTSGELRALQQRALLRKPRAKVPQPAADSEKVLAAASALSDSVQSASGTMPGAHAASVGGSESADASSASAFGRRRSVPLKGISFIQLGSAEQVRVESRYQPAGVYTGNDYEEGVDDQVYFAGAIIVIPPRL